jgi:hypothetical protein
MGCLQSKIKLYVRAYNVVSDKQSITNIWKEMKERFASEESDYINRQPPACTDGIILCNRPSGKGDIVAFIGTNPHRKGGTSIDCVCWIGMSYDMQLLTKLFAEIVNRAATFPRPLYYKASTLPQYIPGAKDTLKRLGFVESVDSANGSPTWSLAAVQTTPAFDLVDGESDDEADDEAPAKPKTKEQEEKVKKKKRKLYSKK